LNKAAFSFAATRQVKKHVFLGDLGVLSEAGGSLNPFLGLRAKPALAWIDFNADAVATAFQGRHHADPGPAKGIQDSILGKGEHADQSSGHGENGAGCSLRDAPGVFYVVLDDGP